MIKRVSKTTLLIAVTRVIDSVLEIQ